MDDRASPLDIAVEGVGFTYAGATRPALRGVDLRVPAGALLLVVGPSGSGKSTLARAVAGLVPRDVPGTWQGSIRIGDVDITGATARDAAASVGLLFQDPGSQLVMDRVADDVAFGLENRGWARETMLQAVPDALREVGLEGFDDRRAARLSGGEQQRLALAGVLAPWPTVVVLDEPTANLDPENAARLYERLDRLKAAGTTTFVLVDHRADLAWPLADLVLALDAGGTPIDVGTPRSILDRSAARLEAEGIWRPGDAALAAASARRSQPPPRPDPASAAERSSEPVVRARDLRFGYGSAEPVVRDVDLEIEGGERVALVGPNGSGKSTLLRLLAGLGRPSAGTVRVGGLDPARLAPSVLADRVGFVFQDPELGFLADTVAGEIGTGLPGGDPEAAAEAEGWLARLGLPLAEFGPRSPYGLSGGEQRRLSVATALVRRPRLLLLDEPTYGQDRRGWEAMAAIVDEVAGAGTTVIAATHDEAFAARIADRRVELAEGWIVADEPC